MLFFELLLHILVRRTGRTKITLPLFETLSNFLSNKYVLFWFIKLKCAKKRQTTYTLKGYFYNLLLFFRLKTYIYLKIISSTNEKIMFTHFYG